MEIKQIRMGIVGAGTWGRTHASIYAEHLFADPVAICDMNEARAREIADEFGIRKDIQIIMIWQLMRRLMQLQS